MPSGETLSNSCYNPQGGSSLAPIPRAESPKRESADNKATESECNYSSPTAAAATGERGGEAGRLCAKDRSGGSLWCCHVERGETRSRYLGSLNTFIRRGNGVKNSCLNGVVLRRKKENATKNSYGAPPLEATHAIESEREKLSPTR